MCIFLPPPILVYSNWIVLLSPLRLIPVVYVAKYTGIQSKRINERLDFKTQQIQKKKNIKDIVRKKKDINTLKHFFPSLI